MGKRNRERIARIEAGREKSRSIPMDPKEKAEQGFCPFPGCQGRPDPVECPHGFCFAHEKFVADLCFILPHITFIPEKTKDGLLLPGQPGFNVVPEEVVKGEMEKHGRLKQ